MTQLDWIIVAFATLLAFFGFRQGFIVGVLSFAGFVIGAFLGTRLGPLLLPQGSASPYAPAFGLVGALLAGAILASGLEGIGFMLRRTLALPGIGLLDGVLGAAFGGALGLGIIWIVAAVAAQAPGQSQLRADIQRSAILRGLNEILPPSGSILNALARLDPIPSVTGPSPGVAPPEPRIENDPSRSRGLDAVVASMTPSAPFMNLTVATAVSSASIFTSAVMPRACTLSTSPMNQLSISTWWLA